MPGVLIGLLLGVESALVFMLFLRKRRDAFIVGSSPTVYPVT